MEPKMGVNIAPRVWDKIDAMLWVQVRVSAMTIDIARSQMVLCRCFSQTTLGTMFPSQTNLIYRTGERTTKHPCLSTEGQLDAMDRFIDDMNLVNEGETEDG